VKRDVWLYAVALAVGICVWLAVAHTTGKREAWDSEVYFSFGMPIVCAISLLLGAAQPRRSWRWGATPLAGQFATMLVTQGVGNLLPLGVIVFAILSIPSILTARLGAYARKRWF
jgi:hypothetical protein